MAWSTRPARDKKVKPDWKDPDERIVLPNTGDTIPMDVAKLLCSGITDTNKQKYLMYLSVLGNRSRAAQAVPISPTMAWIWRRDDEIFRARYEDAMRIAGELHENEMFRRASEGVLEPVYQGGKFVGSIRRYSDTLLMFALRGSMPEKYRDNIKIEGTVDVVSRLRAARDRALRGKKE